MNTSDLESVVARTGHERYRWLTSDANLDEASREGYRRVVREMAGSEPTPPPSAPPPDFAELRNATRLGSKNCWFSEHGPGCGCSGLHCHRLRRNITIYDCVACLKRW